MKNKVYLLLDEKLFKLKELYFCLTCSKIKNEYNIKQEIEYYFCNGCTQIYTKSESAIYSYECLRCFKCPCCFTCLTISQKWLGRPVKKLCTLEPLNKGGKDDNLWGSNNEEANGEKNVEDACTSPFLSNNRKKSNDEKISFEGNSALGKDDENDIQGEKNKVGSKLYNFFKRGKNVFYFKCPYCLWSSISSVYNTKLDELIGDMILAERNCVYKRYFQTVLEELLRSNEELKEKRNFKRTNQHATLHKIGKLKSIHDLNRYMQVFGTTTEDFSLDDLTGGVAEIVEVQEQTDNTLICKSKMKVDKMRLKDILNGEHIKNREIYRDIFELENEHMEYLDPIEYSVQSGLQEVVQRREERNGPMGDDHPNGGNPTRGIGEALPEEQTIEKLKIQKNGNLIIHAKNDLSIRHMEDYPYNYYKDMDALQPLRMKLINKKSKRCSTCKQYILKLHNSNVSSSFRLDNNAMKFIPTIYINDLRLVKGKNGILNFVLVNPLDSEMNIKVVPDIENNFVKNLNGCKIPVNCKSRAASFEFTMDSYDEITDELLNEEKNDIKNVFTLEYNIVKKQNNMALIIISFFYTNEGDALHDKFYSDKNKPGDSPQQGDPHDDLGADEVRKLNFPLTLECSFSDKSKKVHKLKLNLLFTNNISLRPFRHYALRDCD
ncbi:dynactin subunit 4, putative [Plasmodium knowlesi strain H]|uniref:Dynactin subunit 4 n=3 Tax=Plasmodium knowlesi TaxID=5850 RepID=A0A5K1TUS0_PLAKH|nr:dynactin subunit 4, putative [Plasmodium knowlesi strain H]OTN65266.1 putative Dynactin subunit 4 [Plasmodium knowlesi]CAA9989618.1 dynactin subunit 4, putative [Plasmodium knowlesi strain H]SBO22699.1 dynactin subunit 4, putative [Plasmodium knowlesi strain H]SBO23237.1 dynactin subunit 4, putative [Plasmodium knowlesi strain H]VVS79092.1 dynactin subunit 4, putative [Plasmodium knowlesi strain H]|eukprot:XP_002260343.1 hypothetical protein, conserved in Plasmodium species [Plasmodium knowlesi strain H]